MIAYCSDLYQSCHTRSLLIFTTLLFSLDPSSTSAASCDNAYEEAVKLWYNQVKGYSFAAPSLDSDTDTFTQVRILSDLYILRCILCFSFQFSFVGRVERRV